MSTHVERALIDSLETSLSNSREQVMNLIRERDEIKQRLAAAEARVTELTAQLALRLRAEGCDREELLKECIANREKLAAAETEVENLRLQCAAFDYSLTQAEDSAAARMQERDECRRLLREACEYVATACFNDAMITRWAERAAKGGWDETETG